MLCQMWSKDGWQVHLDRTHGNQSKQKEHREDKSHHSPAYYTQAKDTVGAIEIERNAHLHALENGVISTWLEMVIEQVVPLVCISDPTSNEACHITTVLSKTQSWALSSRRTRAMSLIRRSGGRDISWWFRSTQVCVCMTCTVCMSDVRYRN